MIKDPSLREEVDIIVHCIAGGDGCVPFSLFLTTLNRLKDEADAGGQAASELLLVVTRFSRLIQVTTTPKGEGVTNA